MRKLILSSACAVCSFLMLSCSSSKQAISISALNGKWNFVEVNGKIVSPVNGNIPFIGFDVAKESVYGNSGCNRIRGRFRTNSAKAGFLSFGPISGTRMACPDMSAEETILSALGQVKSYKEVAGKKLSIALCNTKGRTVALLVKTPSERDVDLAMLDGEWKIEEIHGEAPGESEKIPYIGFNVADKRVYGNAGCNSINGMLEQEAGAGNSIDLSKLATTMMMCADMKTEQQILKALNAIKSFNPLPKGKIGLYDAEGNLVITLIRRR